MISARQFWTLLSEARNLLVPVCMSASHVAYSTLRMEPQYMIIGEAAGVAARMAAIDGADVQDVDPVALTARLRELGAIMEIGNYKVKHQR